jgi:cob(I)alamin adenosyltransferase
MASLEDADIAWIESEIDAMDAGLPALKSFILPMGTPLCASLHLARCVCRRAERRVVSLLNADAQATVHGLIFLNRLSDFLFVLARVAQHKAGFEDLPWYPRARGGCSDGACTVWGALG